MEQQAPGYPEHFTLTATATAGAGSTGRSASTTRFTFGDASTLPYEPMEYITRQARAISASLDQRDGNLWMDAGMVTTQADWSLDFDIGMNFMEWHGPVPLAHEMGVFDRALKFLLNLQQGKPARRLNWTMTINPRLDTSPENYHKWGPDRDDGDAGECRRQGASARRTAEPSGGCRARNAIVFPIRCYLIKHGRTGDGAEMGAAPASRARDLPAGARRLQGPDAVSADAGRVAVQVRRRQPDLARASEAGLKFRSGRV